MEENTLEKFLEDITSISFEDNKENTKYTITKDEKNKKYIIETSTTKTIDSNEKIDIYFEKLENYFNSINEEDYWPNSETENPDLLILWKMYKYGKDNTHKSGALKYPDDWESMLEELKKYVN